MRFKSTAFVIGVIIVSLLITGSHAGAEDADFENMLENLLLAYEAGMEVEEADMIARAIPEWENMNLPMLTAAFGEVLEEENGEFETVLEQILERAREITEEVEIE